MTETVVRGRPSLCTPERTAAICAKIAEGSYISVACSCAGVSADSYNEWMTRGDADKRQGADTVYARFFDAVKAAEALQEHSIVQHVVNAAPDNWIAAMTYLERRHPERWSRKDRYQIDRNNTNTVRIEYAISGQEPLPALPGPSVEGEYRELNPPAKLSDLDTSLSGSGAANS